MSTEIVPALRFLLLFVCGFAAISPAAQPSLNGVWRSHGYAYIFEIAGPSLKAFEVTTTTCVLGFSAQLQRVAAAGRQATFKSKDEGVFFVRAGGSNDHKLIHQEETVPDIRIDRIASLPAVCDHLTSDTPSNNFEVFARTWAEQYISFDRRHTDWERVVAEYRPKVNPATTPKQLFDIFEAMIQPLGDLHTSIEAPALKKSTGVFWRAGTDRMIKGGMGNFAKRGRWTLFSMIDQTYLQAAPEMFCKRQLQYGHIDEPTGYLRILAFGGYSRRNDLKALENALDSIFADPRLHSLVIDMRLSFGGSDELGLAIANRMASGEFLPTPCGRAPIRLTAAVGHSAIRSSFDRVRGQAFTVRSPF
jgi:carboxyl-terminal processing protease